MFCKGKHQHMHTKSFMAKSLFPLYIRSRCERSGREVKNREREVKGKGREKDQNKVKETS